LSFDGIIFDLDGTLWDSCRSVAESWTETIARLHGGLVQLSEQDIKGIMGMSPEQIAAKLFSVYGVKTLEVCQDCLDNEYAYIAIHGAELYPGVRELLLRLSQSHKLYIVSNCQTGYIKCFYEYTGLGSCFADFECLGKDDRSKADNIALIVKRNRLNSAVYVGDTGLDELSTHQAGLPFVHAAYGFGQSTDPEFTINSPLELLDIIGD
jgi:phosphoglycolate phosphatase